jgi:DNA-directed RNA polymerase subunit alpha
MFQVQCLESAQKAATENVAKFCIEPLSKGQGITIGNALRRTLLSNIPGTAIVGTRISGVDHEFSVIPGVKEDALEILLNLKQLVFKGNLNEPIITRLNIQGPCIVTAGDIDIPTNLELIDPQQYIATITDFSHLEMEFILEQGESYVLSEKTASNNPRGFLAVDGVFTPIKKVNFFVEISSSKERLEKERLIIEIETNGSILPLEALDLATERLSSLFKLVERGIILRYSADRASKFPPTVVENIVQVSQTDVTGVLIEELELSIRAYNCLKRAQIHTLGELLKYSKENLLEFKNFGQKSANEVCENLHERFNLTLN